MGLNSIPRFRRIESPHVMESGKFLLVESGIRNPGNLNYGIKNPGF